jgi:hypothetical protein
MGVSTVEIENVLCVETNFFELSRFSWRSRWTFFFLVEIFKIEIFQLRLWRVKIDKICWDALRFSRFVMTQSRFVEKSRHCRGLLSLKMMKSLDRLRNLDKKIQKSTHFSIEIKTKLSRNAKIFRSRQISRSQSWSGHWCRDKIEKSQSRSRYLDCRD